MNLIYKIVPFLILSFPAYAQELNCDKIKEPGNSFLEQAQHAQESLKDMNRINVCRNKKLYGGFKDFLDAEHTKRLSDLNDMYLPHTDFSTPPSELFKQRTLLVIKTSNLCLGMARDGTGRVSFFPCSERIGELLWHTLERYVDGKEVLSRSQNKSFKKSRLYQIKGTRKYSQIKHNGKCLTFPQALQAHDPRSKERFKKIVQKIANDPTKARPRVNLLKMETCDDKAVGQLWKITITSDYGNKKERGYRLKERSSGYCVRTEADAAHLNDQKRSMYAVVYPCTGSPNEIFEVRRNKRGDIPVWYDHSGVIKTDNEYCLDVPNSKISTKSTGTPVFLKKCEDDEYDRWDFVVEYDKKVKIVNDLTGFCLYPYKSIEGHIKNAKTNQLVQRPCADRNDHDWYVRLIEDQDYFQLEATDLKTDKPSGKCMVADDYSPDEKQVKVFVKDCDPVTRGRWKFGHWKGKVEWVEWDIQNVDRQQSKDCDKREVLGINDLSCIYGVDKGNKDKFTGKDKLGVCRIISGDYKSGRGHQVVPGTWDGSKCSYVEEASGEVLEYDPSSPNQFSDLEVMTGLRTSCAIWADSRRGIPKFQDTDKNKLHPKPKYAAFLVGGSSKEPHFYLCRKKIKDGNWLYGFQTDARDCKVGLKPNPLVTGQKEVLTLSNFCEK